jgi:hypothetical protein
MAYTETGKEKEKRVAWEKGNKERGVEAEKKRDYKLFGTTEQNIPAVDNMGNVTGMKKGGKVMKKARRYEDGGEIEFESKQGKSSSIDDDTRAKALDFANSKVEDEPMVDTRPASKKAAPAKSAPAKSASKFSSTDTGGGAAVAFRKQSAPKAASKPVAKKDSYTPDHSMGAAMKCGGKVKKMASGGKVAGKLATRGYGIAKGGKK